MRLRRVDVAAIVTTIIFIAFVAGMYMGKTAQRADFSISVQNGALGAENSGDALARSSAGTDSSAAAASLEQAQPELVNINSADAQALMALPGIGEVLARRIIDYRDEHGDFKHITEIMDVSGIGEKIFEKIENYITTEA